jgi:hypothetical protein
MIYFLISPLFLFTYKWRPAVGVASIVLTIVASVTATLTYSAKENIYSLIDISGTATWGDNAIMYIR